MELDTGTIFDPPVIEATATEVVDAPIAEPTEALEQDPAAVVEPTVEESSEVADPSGDEPTKEAEVEAKAEEAPTEEPVVFDATLETPELIAKTTEIFDKYELPADALAAIDALRAKAEAIPSDPLEKFRVYGDDTAITSLLDKASLLDDHTEVGDGQYRPKTAEFVETLAPNVKEWMFFDLAKEPSEKYPGRTKFEEGIISVFAKDGDTVGGVLARYEQVVEAMQHGLVNADVPAFIPSNLHEAYFKLPKETRNELSLLDPADYPDDATAVQNKISELALIQRGLDSERADNRRNEQIQQSRVVDFQNAVITKQEAFIDVMRDQFAKELESTVTFSTDPKLQSLFSKQHVGMIEMAFEDGKSGEFARTGLKDVGVEFDFAKSQQMLKELERVTIGLETQARMVNADGTPINPIQLNKAKNEVENTARAFQTFKKGILEQLAKVTSTGKAEEIKAEVAKQKIAVKARPAASGTGTQAKKQTTIPAYGTRARQEYFANMALEEEQMRSRQYRPQ